MKTTMLVAVAVWTTVVALGADGSAPSWLQIGRDMAADGESVRGGATGNGDWYVVALSEIVPAEETPESVQRARLLGKRLIAGYVAGEKVSASEEATVAETSSGTGDAETQESFRQTITIGVDAVLRGAETAGTVDGPDGRRFLLVVASAAAADAAGELAAEQAKLGPDTVRACGFAPIPESDVARARNAALSSAKASAVEMVLGSSVAATETAMNVNASAKIFANAGGFIEEFRIVEEGDTNGAYRVMIVARVARGKLMEDYASALAQFGNVRFHVEDTGDPALNAMLEEKLLEWKCPVTQDPNAADYVLWSQWTFAEETHPMDGRSGTRLSLTMAMRDAATGKEYFAVNNDPRKSVSFVGDHRRRMRNAADLAMREIHDAIHERLDAMIGNMVASGRDVRMVFDNYSEPHAAALEAIRTAVAGIPGCEGATTKVDTASRTAAIEFRSRIDMDSVRRFMEEAMRTAVPSAAFRPETVSCDAGTWVLSW